VNRRVNLPCLIIICFFYAVSIPSFAQSLYINEFMASNTVYLDEYGEKDDWVEIYNAGDTAVDLGGMYLSDDPANLTKCLIPATDSSATTIQPGGFLLFWFDDKPSQGIRHIKTKLSGDGENILLVASDGTTIIDQVKFGPQVANISRGRQPDGGTNWYFFPASTPNASNNTATPAAPLDPPAFSHAGGFYESEISLTLTASPGTAKIYYTVDGSEPAEETCVTSYNYMPQEIRNGATIEGTGPTTTRTYETKLYTGPISINSNTVVRARVCDAGCTASPVVTHTYIFNNTSTLPVISLSTTPRYLWENSTDPNTGGIFVMGPPPYGDAHDWFPDCNLWEEWERPIHVEFFEPSGTLAFSQVVGIKLSGNTTRLTPQKPGALFARSAYGKGSIDYKIFPDLPYSKFEAIVIRCAGDDWVNTMFQDAMIVGLTKDLDIDIQGYRPAAAYLNGEYYGIYEIRERLNEHYLAAHHGADPDNVDMLENNMEVSEGDATDFTNLMSFVRNTNPNSSVFYSHLKSRMEINNYLDYMISEIYAANTDWPAGNTQYWRPRVPNGRWRWIMHDLDYGFGAPFGNSDSHNNYCGYGTHEAHNTLAYASAESTVYWGNKPWSTELFRRVIMNPTIREEFIRKAADLLNITFRPDRVVSQINDKKAALQGEMPAHIARWLNESNPWSATHSGRPWMTPIPDMYHWEAQVDRLINFANARPNYVRSHIVEKFGLTGTATLNFAISPADAGTIKVNRMILPIASDTTWSGVYFKNIPLQIAASPKRGYRFKEWSGISGSSVVTYSPSMTKSITAIFEADSTNENTILINEINYNCKSDFDTGDWVELYNPNSFPVNLSGWRFKGGTDDKVFTFPVNTTLGSGEYLVVCEDKISFHSLVPAVENYIGNLGFNLKNGGESLSLLDSEGNLIDSVEYDDEGSWPTQPDGDGPTLELMNTALDNADPACWAASMNHGSPGSLNTMFSYRLTTGVVGEHGSLTPATGFFRSGQTITLTATPESGYQVKRWVGTKNDLSTGTTNTVTMNADRTVTVEFEVIPPVQFNLSTSVPTGHGTLTPSSCKKVIDSVVTLIATPHTGYKVRRWTGTDDDTSTATTNTVKMTSNKIVTVEFEPGYVQFKLTTNVVGGHGTITPVTQFFNPGSIVALRATPDSGYRIKKWTGTVNDNTVSVTNSVVVSADTTVTVEFEPMAILQYQLTTLVAAGQGSLIPLSRLYNEGTTVSLTAVPATGYRLKKWSGTNNDALLSSTNTVTMNSNRTVSVEFEPLPMVQYLLSTSVVGGHGTLTPGSGNFLPGTLVTLTATPDAGYRVKKWTGTNNDSSLETFNQVLMNTAHAVSVEFVAEEVPSGIPTQTPTPTEIISPTPTVTPTVTVAPTSTITLTPTASPTEEPPITINGTCGLPAITLIAAILLVGSLLSVVKMEE